jgi:large subunit ribosomal protein L7/L12
VLKVDKIFHKVLWLDMIETALLVELVNKKVGRIGLGPKQRAALERRMEALEGGGGGGGPGGSPAAEEAKAAEEAGPKLVDVKLAGFDGKQKIKVIKEVRSLLGLGLKEAKELVESAPKILSKQIKPEDADEIRQRLEAAGAEVEVS